jgi:hypothetical protein
MGPLLFVKSYAPVPHFAITRCSCEDDDIDNDDDDDGPSIALPQRRLNTNNGSHSAVPHSHPEHATGRTQHGPLVTFFAIWSSGSRKLPTDTSNSCSKSDIIRSLAVPDQPYAKAASVSTSLHGYQLALLPRYARAV